MLQPRTASTDMNRIRLLLGDLINDPRRLPVSFTYAGKTYDALPEGGCCKSRFVDANIVETVYTAALDANLTVRAEIETYCDYPAVEWTVWFENTGSADSAILEAVNAADLTFPGAAPTVITNNGDFWSIDGYTDACTVLGEGVVVDQAPVGGRACNHAFPYQRLLYADHGYSISIGWPGQWRSSWEGQTESAKLLAGQETVHTIVKPGEALRTPRMTIMAFEGDLDRGINIWRRWYHAHVMPKTRGGMIPNLLQTGYNGGGDEWTEATIDQQLADLARVKERGVGENLWWIDAGWYPCKDANGERKWPVTGTWTPDPERFPDGFRAIGDACKAAGMEFLVWFEPERVKLNTWLADNHPEWMLHATEVDAYEDRSRVNMLLNLGDPACLKWLCEHVTALIQESGITFYRQDYNINPLMFWRDSEAEDRKGMVENLYIQGYLAYWDYLLLHNPNLMIDSCASGGRRNDLESMRRAVPLHQTDYGYGHHPIKQRFNQHLYGWIPYFRGFRASWDDENGEYPDAEGYTGKSAHLNTEYDMFCCFAPTMGVGYTSDPENMQLAREMVDLFKRVAHHLRSDYYALTPAHHDRRKWTAWQFYSPENDEGMLMFFRNNAAPEESLNVQLKALCPCTTYIFENGRTGERIEMTGEEAATKGFTESLNLRQASLWTYCARRA